MNKTFITCAVTGAGDGFKRNTSVRKTPKEIAKSALSAENAGAAIVHLRARDPETGEGLRDDTLYRQAIANAGNAGPTALLEEITPQDWSQTIAVNLNGQYVLCRAAIPYLKAAKQGAVILMSSAASRLAFPMRSPYAAANWGVIGLKEILAMELGPHDITVNTILPGSVKGPRMDVVLVAKAKATGIALEAAQAAEVQNASLGRMIDPEEIAELAWFTASPAARSLSGQSLSLCGNFETLR